MIRKEQKRKRSEQAGGFSCGGENKLCPPLNMEVDGTCSRVPLALSFVLIGFLIWIAENTATCFGAWEYPNQTDAWSLVHVEKVSSWPLLVIAGFLNSSDIKAG